MGARISFPIPESVYKDRIDGVVNSLWEGTKFQAISKVFGDEQPKPEGQMVAFDIADMNVTFPVKPEFQNPDTTYVERRVPIGLEDEAHKLLDNWLKSKGFDPEEI